MLEGGAKTLRKKGQSTASEIIKREKSPTRKLQRDFKRIDTEASRKKKLVDQKKAEPLSYKSVTRIAERNHGNAGKATADAAKLVYDNTARKTVDKAKNDATSTYKKYKAVVERSNRMSEAERNELRKQAYDKKHEQKRQEANRIRRLFGLPER